MTKYNKNFELSVDDLELIESALRKEMSVDDTCNLQQTETRAIKHKLNDLLGRLHSQKRFFRPSEGPYVSG